MAEPIIETNITKRFPGGIKVVTSIGPGYESEKWLRPKSSYGSTKEYVYDREDGPAKVKISRDKIERYWYICGILQHCIVTNGACTIEKYYKNGRLHRGKDQPAEIHYCQGMITMEIWYADGDIYRKNNKPTEIHRKNGQIVCETWHDRNRSMEIHYKNGQVTSREWYKEGVIHRGGDLPAWIEYAGDMTIEKWLKNGEYFRQNDRPTEVHRRNGQVVAEIWLAKDNDYIYHRENDLPASIGYGEEIMQEWFKNGEYYRQNDLPTIIIYKNGKKTTEIWATGDGYWHRENDLPAFIHYTDGEIDKLCWYDNNRKHRENGPSTIKKKDDILINSWRHFQYEWTSSTPVPIPPRHLAVFAALPMPIAYEIQQYYFPLWTFDDVDLPKNQCQCE